MVAGAPTETVEAAVKIVEAVKAMKATVNVWGRQ